MKRVKIVDNTNTENEANILARTKIGQIVEQKCVCNATALDYKQILLLTI